MDCQGAKRQKEGQEDQGTLKRQGVGLPRLFQGALALPGPPGNQSSYPYLEACLKTRKSCASLPSHQNRSLNPWTFKDV